MKVTKMHRRATVFSRLTLRRKDDDGIALVVVMGSMLVLAMLAMTALAYTLSSQKFARYDQDYLGAMAAAQSGVEDVISHLNRDDTYGVVPDCTNDAWKGPTTAPNACSPVWNTSTAPGWLPVTPGDTDAKAAYFHYSIDATDAKTKGAIMVTSTGRVNGVYRTVETAVGRGASTDYVYYTDYESADPANVQVYGAGGTPKAACGYGPASGWKYFYNGRDSASCVEIQFASGDKLDGAVFSNDALWSVGATFSKEVFSANPNCKTVTATRSTWVNCLRTGSSAVFGTIAPAYHQPYSMNDTSGAFATDPGCHYVGATRIIFSDNGKMQVWNKKVNNGGAAPTAIAPPGGTAPSCGDPTALDSLGGATVDVPDGMVVYVGGSAAPSGQCTNKQIGGPSGSELPLGTYTTGSSTYKADASMVETTKFCNQGNLYAEGVVKGRVTLSAAQSIIATGDLVLAGGQNSPTDMLGLVATNSVEVFHPMVGDSTSWSPTTVNNQVEDTSWPKRYRVPGTAANVPTSGIQITGSIQTLQHSFLVQKYAVGSPRGTLLVFGSIAQKWRGIVATSGSPGTGYLKLYQYDSRLKYSRPPYFPTWANSEWSLRYSGEINTSPSVRSSAP